MAMVRWCMAGMRRCVDKFGDRHFFVSYYSYDVADGLAPKLCVWAGDSGDFHVSNHLLLTSYKSPTSL